MTGTLPRTRTSRYPLTALAVCWWFGGCGLLVGIDDTKVSRSSDGGVAGLAGAAAGGAGAAGTEAPTGGASATTAGTDGSPSGAAGTDTETGALPENGGGLSGSSSSGGSAHGGQDATGTSGQAGASDRGGQQTGGSYPTGGQPALGGTRDSGAPPAGGSESRGGAGAGVAGTAGTPEETGGEDETTGEGGEGGEGGTTGEGGEGGWAGTAGAGRANGSMAGLAGSAGWAGSTLAGGGGTLGLAGATASAGLAGSSGAAGAWNAAGHGGTGTGATGNGASTAGGAATGGMPSGGTGSGGMAVGGTGGSVQDVRATMTPQNRNAPALSPWPYHVHSACISIPDKASLSAAEMDARMAFARRVQRLFESTWQRAAYITLAWWGDCDDSGGEFRFVLVPDGPSHTDGGYPGVFHDRYVYLWTGASDAEILYTQGKALGLSNEYGLDRLPGDCVPCTLPEECTDEYRDTCLPSGYCGSVSDNESIMAPPDCGGIESIRTFSEWDITAVRLAYGLKPIGSLVSSRGTCALVESQGDGSVGWCQGDDNSVLVQKPATANGEADLMASSLLDEERCLQSTPDVTPGAITYQPCYAADPAQDVRLAPTRIRAMGGLCVVANPVEDTTLTVAKCGTAVSAREQWLVRDGQARLYDTTLCATVRDPPPDKQSLTLIVLKPCGSAADHQAFEVKRGHFRYGDLCWNVAGGLPVIGSRVIIWGDCPMNLNNESFYLSGPVSLAGGAQCLDADFTTGRLEGADCDSRESEQWDFYF
jgi:hypothetical protein